MLAAMNSQANDTADMAASGSTITAPDDVLAEPDVWWGPNGIDALTWADGIPYAGPTSNSLATAPISKDPTARGAMGALQ
jgi:hypothetical protein